MDKVKIKEEISTLHIDYESAESIIFEFQGYITEYGSGNISLEFGSRKYSDDQYIAVMLLREETDQEEKIRENWKIEISKNNENSERKHYEALKIKFG